jgi:hypothetical protein
MTSCQGGKGTGTLFSYAQLEGLWVNAGGPSGLAPVMAAIAEAESSGCSTAYNASGATGLWQILGAVDPSDQANLTDPAVNAKEAVLKYKSQGLGAWVTYTNGAYRAFLNGSTSPDTNVPAGSSAAGSGITTTGVLTPGNCIWALPQLPVIGTPGCLLSYGQARALIGGAALAAGGLAFFAGLLVLAAGGLQGSGAGHAAGGALEAVGAGLVLVPGAEGAGLALGAAGATARRAGSSSGARQSLDRRRTARTARTAAAGKAAGKAAKAGP